MKSRFKKRFSSRLNNVITWQKKAATGKGIDRSEGWIDVYSPWAEIVPISAGEIIKHNREDMRTTHRIRHRYRSGLSSDMRILLGTRKFDVKSIIPVNGEKRKLEILVEEVA